MGYSKAWCGSNVWSYGRWTIVRYFGQGKTEKDECWSVIVTHENPLVQNNRKAVVGSQDGVLSLWNWGDWGDYRDRIMGHPSSIDAICKLDEDTICTGSSDGIIRLVTILPNGFHGILGDHGEGMPIEQIKLSHDKKYLVSSGHDSSLRFWDVAHLFDEEGAPNDDTKDQDDNEDDDDQDNSGDRDSDEDNDNDQNDVSGTQQHAADHKESDGWDDDSDDSDKDDNSSKRKKTPKKQKVPTKKNKPSTFFADL